MDLVFNNNEIDDINEVDNQIDIELKKRGAKKSNTYVKNWNLSKIELKTHFCCQDSSEYPVVVKAASK